MMTMREADIRTLFHGGSRADADAFDAALREAKASRSKAAVFRSAGTDYLLLQNLDDGSWSYRPVRP
jgi:hypothetical protein